MTIRSLDHINVRTPDVKGTAAFLAAALGMDVRPAPGVEEVWQGAWVHDGSGRAIIHLTPADYRFPWEADALAAAPHGSGRLHHVALQCTDYDTVERRLERHGTPYRTNAVPSLRLRQMFVEEPANGVLFELNFFEQPGE